MLNSNVLRKRSATLVIAFFLAAFAISQAEANKSGALPPGKGRDLVVGTCTLCHSASIILQNRMTREAWDETITWMQEEQGLWELEAADRKTILDYLASRQGVEHKIKKDSGKRTNSMYEFDYKPNPL